MNEAVIAFNDSAKTHAIANWMSFTIESNSVINSIQKDARRLEIKMTKKPNLAKIKIHLEFTIKKLHELKEELKQRNTDFENDINKFDSTIVLKNQS